MDNKLTAESVYQKDLAQKRMAGFVDWLRNLVLWKSSFIEVEDKYGSPCFTVDGLFASEKVYRFHFNGYAGFNHFFCLWSGIVPRAQE